MSTNENFFSSIIKSKIILKTSCKLVFCLINLFFNGFIIRYVNLKYIGIVHIRLELFYRTILYLLREPLRHNVPKTYNIHSIYHYINLIWLIISPGLFFILIYFLLILFLQKKENDILYLYYNESYLIYLFCAFIELLSEPFYLLATIKQNEYINIFIEFFASIIGKLINYLILI